MKKQFLILTLLLSTTTFSSLSFGEWELLGEISNGTRFYWDPESVRGRDGFRYYYRLMNYLTPDPVGARSYKYYIQVDCGTLGNKTLSLVRYQQEMGEGYGTTRYSYSPEDAILEYPEQGTWQEGLSKMVCDLSI